MEVEFRKNTDFKNPYYQNQDFTSLKRLTRIPTTEFYKLRVWREFFFKFNDSIHDPLYTLDSYE